MLHGRSLASENCLAEAIGQMVRAAEHDKRISAPEKLTWTIVRRTFHELVCCCKHRASGGFFDQSRHRLRMRYKDRVTALDLNDHRTRALRHLSLGVGWNHLVLGRNQVPARFRFPCWFTDRAVQGVHTP